MAPGSRTIAAAPLTHASYDPKALLNPKAAAKRAKEPQKPATNGYAFSTSLAPPGEIDGKASNSTSAHHPSMPNDQQQYGMSAMLDKLHNVEKRSDLSLIHI